MYAKAYPRKAAQLACEARARGDDPHADKLQTVLITLGHCANCGHPMADPLSVSRGVGPDCWERIDPAWQESISQRLAAAASDVRVREVGGDRQPDLAEAAP